MTRPDRTAAARLQLAANRLARKQAAAADILREGAWIAFAPPAMIIAVDNHSQFQRDVTLFTVEVPNALLEDRHPATDSAAQTIGAAHVRLPLTNEVEQAFRDRAVTGFGVDEHLTDVRAGLRAAFEAAGVAVEDAS